MQLYLFPSLAGCPVCANLSRFRHQSDVEAYFAAAAELLQFSCTTALTTDAVREYVIRQLLDTPGIGQCLDTPTVLPYLEHDLVVLWQEILGFDWNGYCIRNRVLPLPGNADPRTGPFLPAYNDSVRAMVNAPDSAALCKLVRQFFARYGDSQEARYAAFTWKNGALAGITHPDPLGFDGLAGLETQKAALIQNTQNFLAGAPANNVLLVGGSGTGKSSCVKATLNHFAADGLKLVELAKQDIAETPLLMATLQHKKCKYIIFIDDLSFETVDEGYRELKVALEGRLEQGAANAIIYATSNRRRLVRETWADRGEDYDEIHENDTLHEKLSLSQRFGIHLYFTILSQQEYFSVVKILLEQHGTPFTDETAKAAARWALTYNGRSGRTAKQFVSNLLGGQG